MLEFFQKLFSTDFMPHVYCLRLPAVIWLHVISDGVIAASYFLIPAALILLTQRRKDLAFSWMFALFGLFILACGSTHVMSIYTLWHPVYRFDGLVKAVTAMASLPTAFLLFQLLPKAVALPSPAQYRKLVEELEQRVADRTAQLSASEARFRAAVEGVSDMIWTNSPDGRMKGEQRNWGIFTGQTQEEYLDFGWANAVHPADAQPTIDAWQRAVTDRRRFIFEHRVRRNDGVYRLFSVRAVPVLDDTGEIREWVGVHSDITDEREIQEDLRRAKVAAEAASRAKSTFLASMSHELRTPLNAILGYSEILEEEAQEVGASTMVEDLKRIHGAGQHLLSLVDDVLDLSNIESGRIEIGVAFFPVEQLVRGVADQARAAIEKQGNVFTVRTVGKLGNMNSDAGRLRQCLANLLSNAAKFTHHGRVELDVQEKDEETLLFKVSDTGIGIDPASLAMLFEPFTQNDSSYARRFGGTGLGLALTRRLVRMLGGEVSVITAPGTGSLFTLEVPRNYAKANNDSGVRPSDAFIDGNAAG